MRTIELGVGRVDGARGAFIGGRIAREVVRHAERHVEAEAADEDVARAVHVRELHAEPEPSAHGALCMQLRPDWQHDSLGCLQM